MDYGLPISSFSWAIPLKTCGRVCLRFVFSVSVALVNSMTDVEHHFSGSFYHRSLFVLR